MVPGWIRRDLLRLSIFGVQYSKSALKRFQEMKENVFEFKIIPYPDFY